jgi:predicted Holliday junction resolvase-like endonuclease
MAGISVDGSIGSLLGFYKQEKNIYGRCPHCGEPFRLSEVKLTYGKEPPKDLLGRMKRERDRLKEDLEDLEAQIQDLGDDHEGELEALDQRWRDKCDIEIDRRLQKRERQIRQDAIARSRAGQLGKTIEKVVPMFPGFGHHPYDVRPIFDPIDFVVFDGYLQGEVTDICFVEFKTGHARLNSLQASIRNAIVKKRVSFEERRLSTEAIAMLTQKRVPKLLKQLLD